MSRSWRLRQRPTRDVGGACRYCRRRRSDGQRRNPPGDRSTTAAQRRCARAGRGLRSAAHHRRGQAGGDVGGRGDVRRPPARHQRPRRRDADVRGRHDHAQAAQGRAEPVHRVDATPGAPPRRSRLRNARDAWACRSNRPSDEGKVDCHEPGHGQHSGRQHLRGQRSARRSRSHPDGEPRPLPGGHAVSVALDPDGRRDPAEDAVRRRAGLLQGQVLRGGDDGDDLRRLPSVADAAALRLRRLRGDDRDREPRQGAGRAGREARSGRRLRRPVRGEGQAGQGRPALHATSTAAR